MSFEDAEVTNCGEDKAVLVHSTGERPTTFPIGVVSAAATEPLIHQTPVDRRTRIAPTSATAHAVCQL